MTKITKEMCRIFVRDHVMAKLVCSAIFLGLFNLVMWIINNRIIVNVIITVVTVAFLSIWGMFAKHRIVNIGSNGFYLTEDVVVVFKKKYAQQKEGTSNVYTYEFGKYGKYSVTKSTGPSFEIPPRKNKSTSHLTVDKATTQSHDIGDRFYLLVLEERGRTRIVKAFYRCCYELGTEDFNEVDGKYYIK